jgi:hypothetical protein
MRKILLLLFLILSGCSLFSVREAESPDGGSSSLWLAPSSPQNLVFNFEQAVNLLNTSHYLECLADSSYQRNFLFVPDAGVADLTIFSSWGADEESNWFSALERWFTGQYADSVHTLQFSDREFLVQGDTAQFHANYLLELHLGDSLIGNFFAGDIQLRMTNQGTYHDWVIYYWEDNSTSQLPTWSQCKARFAQ